MILSLQELFGKGQIVTVTTVSTNTLDFGAPGTVPVADRLMGRDLGIGKSIPLLIQLNAAATGTTPTLQVAFQQSADNATWTTIAETPVLAGGAEGDILELDAIPRGFTQRYAQLNYVVGGTTPSYTITAGIATAIPGGA